MKMLKTGISSLLLLSYLWGFGHSLIPHCQEDCLRAETSSENLHHHQHLSEKEAHKNGNTDHIHHNNHIDDNWLDLYLCILSEYEHHSGEKHPPKTDEDNDSRLVDFQFSMVYPDLFETNIPDTEHILALSHENRKINAINAPPVNKYLCLFTKETSFRGPPVLSC